MKSYVFSETATLEPPDILNGMTPKQFLKSKYVRGSIFGLDSLMSYGLYKYMGWAFDFTPFLKKFITKQYGILSEQYAPNKTALRKATYGEIEILCELEK